MHKHIIHNKCHETFRDFSAAILTFLRVAKGFSDSGVSGV